MIGFKTCLKENSCTSTVSILALTFFRKSKSKFNLPQTIMSGIHFVFVVKNWISKTQSTCLWRPSAVRFLDKPCTNVLQLKICTTGKSNFHSYGTIVFVLLSFITISSKSLFSSNFQSVDLSDLGLFSSGALPEQ